jgi:hypothetical protein
LHVIAVAPDNELVVIVLDLMHPAQPSRRLGGADGDARLAPNLKPFRGTHDERRPK